MNLIFIIITYSPSESEGIMVGTVVSILGRHDTAEELKCYRLH